MAAVPVISSQRLWHRLRRAALAGLGASSIPFVFSVRAVLYDGTGWDACFYAFLVFYLICGLVSDRIAEGLRTVAWLCGCSGKKEAGEGRSRYLGTRACTLGSLLTNYSQKSARR